MGSIPTLGTICTKKAFLDVFSPKRPKLFKNQLKSEENVISDAKTSFSA